MSFRFVVNSVSCHVMAIPFQLLFLHYLPGVALHCIAYLSPFYLDFLLFPRSVFVFIFDFICPPFKSFYSFHPNLFIPSRLRLLNSLLNRTKPLVDVVLSQVHCLVWVSVPSGDLHTEVPRNPKQSRANIHYTFGDVSMSDVPCHRGFPFWLTWIC